VSTGTGVRDSRGNPLTEGARVEAWRDGQHYLATVKEVRPHELGDGDFRRVVLIREGDHAEMGSFSDAVRVIPAHLWPCGCLINDAGAHRVGCPDHPEGVRG
jgi:hypothetical protein